MEDKLAVQALQFAQKGLGFSNRTRRSKVDAAGGNVLRRSRVHPHCGDGRCQHPRPGIELCENTGQRGQRSCRRRTEDCESQGGGARCLRSGLGVLIQGRRGKVSAFLPLASSSANRPMSPGLASPAPVSTLSLRSLFCSLLKGLSPAFG